MTTTRPPFSRPVYQTHYFTHPARAVSNAEAELFAEMIAPIFGGDSGYLTEGDVLAKQTADGVPLNTLWAEFAQVLTLFNEKRTAYSQLLSYPTTALAEPIPQSVSSESFDEASEFGVPTGAREPGDHLLVGYDFKDYDKATRFTWRFLRDATAEQVQAQFTRILEADNKLVNGTILDRLFNPKERLSPEAHRVFGLYTGTDGIIPPPHLGHEFLADTNHYLASQSAVLDSADIEDAMRLITQKGYGTGESGGRLVILCSEAEAEAIQSWKKGTPNGADPANVSAPVAKYDFIPSAASDPYFTTESIVGQVPSGEYANIKVLGQYGPALLLEPSYFIPEGYVAVVATGGPNSSINPIAVRQHTNADYQGLRIIPGRDQRYPLQESFFARSFGTGVRHRGAACVVQVTTGTVYTPPTIPR